MKYALGKGKVSAALLSGLAALVTGCGFDLSDLEGGRRIEREGYSVQKISQSVKNSAFRFQLDCNRDNLYGTVYFSHTTGPEVKGTVYLHELSKWKSTWMLETTVLKGFDTLYVDHYSDPDRKQKIHNQDVLFHSFPVVVEKEDDIFETLDGLLGSDSANATAREILCNPAVGDPLRAAGSKQSPDYTSNTDLCPFPNDFSFDTSEYPYDRRCERL